MTAPEELYREGSVVKLVAEFDSPDVGDVTFEVTDPGGATTTYPFGSDRTVMKMQESPPNASAYECYVALDQPGNWSYKASGKLLGLEIAAKGEFFVHGSPSKHSVKAYVAPMTGELPPPVVEQAKQQAAALERKLPLADAVELVMTALAPAVIQQMDAERRKAVVARLRAVVEQIEDEPRRKDFQRRLAACEGGKPLERPGGFVVKMVGGQLRWFGRPSLNVEDRVNETVSKAFLEDLIAKEKARGHYPRLEFFHTNYPVGYTDDYRVVDGVLVATGGFNQDPISQAIAKGYAEHPEGTDGTGWAMSWRFRARRDPDGVFRKVTDHTRIREFTFLPTSQAALPITKFDLKEVA